MKAYVLIQAAPDSVPIAQALRAIPGVVSAEDLGGPFDAIALAGSDSTRDLLDGVLAEIRKVPGVLRALPAPLIGSLAKAVRAA